MRKKWSTLAFGFLVAAYAHIRIKEKRSVKSYMFRQVYDYLELSVVLCIKKKR